MANSKKSRSRDIAVQVYLNENEQFILDRKCIAVGGVSRSALLRRLIVYGSVYEADYSLLQEQNALLGRISANLNQIAKRINATDHIYQDDINEMKELMNQIWQSQQSILSRQPLDDPSLTSAIPTKPTAKS